MRINTLFNIYAWKLKLAQLFILQRIGLRVNGIVMDMRTGVNSYERQREWQPGSVQLNSKLTFSP